MLLVVYNVCGLIVFLNLSSSIFGYNVTFLGFMISCEFVICLFKMMMYFCAYLSNL